MAAPLHQFEGDKTQLHQISRTCLTVDTFKESLERLVAKNNFYLPEAPDKRGYSPIHYLIISLDPVDDKLKGVDVQRLDLLVGYYTTGHQKCKEDVVVNVPTHHSQTPAEDEISTSGETPLHLALKFKRWALADRLIDLGANPSLENERGWLPLHNAALRIRPRHIREDQPDFKRTLDKLFAKHPNLKNVTFKTGVPGLVEIAVACCNLDALTIFDSHGLEFTPIRQLFVVAVTGLVTGVASHVQPQPDHSASECFTFLLDRVSECVHRVEDRQPTYQETVMAALFVAVEKRNPILTETVLDHVLVTNKKGLAHYKMTSEGLSSPLHILARPVELDISAEYNASSEELKCANLLLDTAYFDGSIAEIIQLLQLTNERGETALDICCEVKNARMADAFLRAAMKDTSFPDVTLLPLLFEPPRLSNLYRQVPEALPLFLAKAYEVQEEKSYFGPDALDYSVICYRNLEDSSHLYNIIQHSDKAGVREAVLLNKLTEQYLAFRWTSMEEICAYLSVAFQSFGYLIYCLAISTYNGVCGQENNSTEPTTTPDQGELGEVSSCWGDTGTALAWLALLWLCSLLVIELVQLVHSGRTLYFRQWYNRVQWFSGTVAVVSVVLALSSLRTGLWELSVIGILFACLVSIMQLRNIPRFAVHISILSQVTTKSLKILGIFFPILFAFTLLFRIIVRKGTFQTLSIFLVPVKLFAVMIGELTFNEIVADLETPKTTDEIWRYIVAIVVFTILTFVGTIVLLNLLIAMAVNVTAKVKEKAKTKKAICILEQIYFVETLHPKLVRARAWIGDNVVTAWSGLKSCIDNPFTGMQSACVRLLCWRGGWSPPEQNPQGQQQQQSAASTPLLSSSTGTGLESSSSSSSRRRKTPARVTTQV